MAYEIEKPLLCHRIDDVGIAVGWRFGGRVSDDDVVIGWDPQAPMQRVSRQVRLGTAGRPGRGEFGRDCFTVRFRVDETQATLDKTLRKIRI